jgi:serine/threonine protein kinase
VTSPNWDRVKHVFQEALERPAGEQLAFARERCGNDRAALAEVESLLAAHKQAGRFAERPAVELLQALPLEHDSDDGRDPVGVLHPGARLGAYEIQSLVGSGGMGEVYKARDTRLDRTVAIKVLRAHAGTDSGARERFEREARAVAALSHPHICTLHDIGHQDGIDFLVMEHLTGETLAQRLTSGPLSLDQAVEVAIQMASALDTAHRAGIVHRDLKPGNIFLVQSSRASSSIAAKLLDFGLAKTNDVAVSALPSQSPPSRLTSVGSIVGTVQYMAPEQVEHGVADTRADIFAFGAVLYEMVAARRAFEGDSEAAVIGAILQHDPPELSSLQPLAAPIRGSVAERSRSPARTHVAARWQCRGSKRAGLGVHADDSRHIRVDRRGGGARIARGLRDLIVAPSGDVGRAPDQLLCLPAAGHEIPARNR